MKKLLSLCLLSLACYAMPQQVVIIRHGEKQSDGQLSATGLRRAGALASFFTQLDASTTNPPLFVNGLPTAIFGSRPANHGTENTVRCIQTVIPTATTLGLPVHSPFGPGQEQELANFILSSPQYDGGYVLICWHHTDINTLISAFGYVSSLPVYPSDRFDLVWPMTFPAPSPPQTLTPILQELLFGDSNMLPP